jgi:D-lactate dehydrogenase (cytochrome)
MVFAAAFLLGLSSFAIGHYTATAAAETTDLTSNLRTGSTRPLSQTPPLSYHLSPENLHGARDELVSLLGASGVNEDLGTRISHSSTEWSSAPRGDLDRPAFIVYPGSTEEVSAVASILHRRRIPSIGYSGGTSLEGTLAAHLGGVCIDFCKMNKILAIHKRDMDVVVQPGVAYEELNATLAPEGLFFPPDPGPGAQIGGMVSQGCSGTNAFRYGTMKDWVLGLTVVLADGTVVKTRHRPRKSSSGYNLTSLIVGSEGTLGWVTEASLKLTRKQENVQVAVAAFQSTHRAVEAAIKVVQSGLPVAAVELLDETTMYAVNEGGYVDKKYPEVATLFFKFSGSKVSVQEQIAATARFAKEENCTNFEFSKSDDQAAGLWAARKTALWSLLAIKADPSDKFLSADAAVPISRLADIIEKTHDMLKQSGLIGSCLGHVGDGNFHTTVLYGQQDKEKAREIITAVQKMAVEMEGTVTGEHGIGLEYRDMVVYELGESAVDAMRQVKLALDPLCLLNPDKMIRMQPADDEE